MDQLGQDLVMLLVSLPHLLSDRVSFQAQVEIDVFWLHHFLGEVLFGFFEESVCCLDPSF